MNLRTRPKSRLRSARFAVGAAVALVACAAFAPAAVANAPGNPGVPSEPTTLYSENFENGLDLGEIVLLDSSDPGDDTYVGAGGRTYTADPYWLNTAQCNGIVLDASILEADLEATGCTSDQGFDELIQLAGFLGDFNGSTNPAANHVVSQFTADASTSDEITITTEQPIDLPRAGRFLNASLNVGANSCEADRAAKPQLNFVLVDGVDEQTLNSAPIDVCAMIRAATGQVEGAVEVAPNRAVLFEGTEAGIIVRNLNGGSEGNDYAIDDLRLLDVTPQLDKEFSDDGDTLETGDVTDLVLTITNTSELSEKTGWSFTDTLPKGLKVAGAATHDCAAATVTAATGAGSIELSDGSLAAGAESCSITVPVSAAGAGTYKNSAHNIESVGLDAPGSTVVSYAADDVAAPDTGEQRASAWQPWVAIGAGLAVLMAMMTRFVAIRRRA